MIDTTNKIDVRLGLRLRQARVARGLTQEGLGMLVGVSFQQIQKYENGSNRISVGRLQQMIEVLGVSLDDLLDIDRPEPLSVDTDAWQLIRLVGQMTAPMRARVRRIVELCAED